MVRKARMSDIREIASLINDYASREIMLPRNEMELAESIRDFSVCEIDGAIAGCVALHFYTTTAGEVRSLAVDPQHVRAGIGRLLVEALEREARDADLAILFAFTYVPGFFEKLDYELVDRNVLPLKAWKDCLRCPKFQNCDEIAVLKRLKAVELRSQVSDVPARSTLIQLPIPAG
jgi:amino-acid N-acetyltransferase